VDYNQRDVPNNKSENELKTWSSRQIVSHITTKEHISILKRFTHELYWRRFLT